MKEQYYIISATMLKEILRNDISDEYCFSKSQIEQIVNRQINDLIANGDITPTIFEKE